MKDRDFFRVLATLAVVGLFYVGQGLRQSGSPTAHSSQQLFAAGVAVSGDEPEVVLTSSEDGRTIYVWQLRGRRAPRWEASATVPSR